jgi:hypothetical protein
LKTEDSAGIVPIDRRVRRVLAWIEEAQGQYVVEGGTGATMSKLWGQRYRCTGVFDRLTQWLRDQGVEGTKPIHTLRKEAGSLIATEAGTHAASRFLRADIQVTSMHYADHNERVVIRIGALLDPPNVVAISALPASSNAVA